MKWDEREGGLEDWKKKEKWETLLLENGFMDGGNSFGDQMELCGLPYRDERPLEREESAT